MILVTGAAGLSGSAVARELARQGTTFRALVRNPTKADALARLPGVELVTGTVTSAVAVPKKPGVGRQTPRVSIAVGRTALAKRRLGRSEPKPFSEWDDGRRETELNFKFYRQATNEIAGISDEAAAFLRRFM